jgi:phosphatidylglycerophosphate synthase
VLKKAPRPTKQVNYKKKRGTLKFKKNMSSMFHLISQFFDPPAGERESRSLFNLPNMLSLSRGGLAFLLLIDDSLVRTLAILMAMLSDGLDGYLARKLNQRSAFGAFLDPLMDKFFAAFALCIFLEEKRLNLWQAATLLCRDFSVLAFGLFLLASKKWKIFRFQSLWMGKLTTFLQFIVLMGIVNHVQFPDFFFELFILLGILAFIELSVFRLPRPI